MNNVTIMYVDEENRIYEKSKDGHSLVETDVVKSRRPKRGTVREIGGQLYFCSSCLSSLAGIFSFRDYVHVFWSPITEDMVKGEVMGDSP